MIKNTKAERRQYPRREQRLPIKLAVNGYDFITSTHNVSCVGAYCHVTKYMPPFTKVVVKLTLPIITDNGNKNYNAECKGVVVRSVDESNGGFNIAIFFNEIKDDQRKKISQYVKQFFPEKSSSFKR